MPHETPNNIASDHAVTERTKKDIEEKLALEQEEKNKKIEKKIYKAAVVNANKLLETQARDIGDANMTESSEERSGNWLKKHWNRIWKHNLAQEYYRQKKIAEARNEIIETGNLYAGEKGFGPDNVDTSKASEEAMQAIVNRFTSEYEKDTLREDELKSKKEKTEKIPAEVNEQIKNLIRAFAGGSMDKAAFTEERNRILAPYDPEIAKKGSLYADNLFTIAEEVRSAVDHGTKLTEIDFDVEITLGTARDSLSTKANFNAFDKSVEYLQNSKVGKYIVNAPGAMLATAAVYGAVLVAGEQAGRWGSKFANIFTFGAAGLAFSGGVAALKESARVTRERSQHMRERAKGMEFTEEDMKRRRNMEKNTYEMKGATEIIAGLEADLKKVNEGKLPAGAIEDILGRVADLEARTKLNNQKNIDLISYDKFNSIETDRTDLLVKNAELKVALRNAVASGAITLPGPENFDRNLEILTNVYRDLLVEGEKGIEAKDRIFRKMKAKRVAGAFAKTVIVGSAVGLAVYGVAHLAGPIVHKLQEWIGGKQDLFVPKGQEQGIIVGNGKMLLPEGVSIHASPDGTTYEILNGDQTVASGVHLKFNPDGTLAPGSQAELAQHGIVPSMTQASHEVSQHVSGTAHDYMQNHPDARQIHRDGWMDNDTRTSNLNELKTHWGSGIGAPSMDAQGNITMNIAHMTQGGSFHEGMHVDVPGQASSGNMKMLFSLSLDSQHRVFEIPVDAKGNIDIPPDHPINKLMFKNVNGETIFTGKLAEVAQSVGFDAAGEEHFQIISTIVGPGQAVVDHTIVTTVPDHIVRLNIPTGGDDYHMPFVPVPIVGRRPLERGQYKKDATIQERNKPKSSVIDAIYKPGQGFHAEPTKIEKKKGNDYALNPNADYVYGFMGTNAADLGVRVATYTQKHAHPEVLVFEADPKKREEFMAQIEYMKPRHPNVTFTYVELPQTKAELVGQKFTTYMEDRFRSIVDSSDVDPDIAHILQTDNVSRQIEGFNEEIKAEVKVSDKKLEASQAVSEDIQSAIKTLEADLRQYEVVNGYVIKDSEPVSAYEYENKKNELKKLKQEAGLLPKVEKKISPENLFDTPLEKKPDAVSTENPRVAITEEALPAESVDAVKEAVVSPETQTEKITFANDTDRVLGIMTSTGSKLQSEVEKIMSNKKYKKPAIVLFDSVTTASSRGQIKLAINSIRAKYPDIQLEVVPVESTEETKAQKAGAYMKQYLKEVIADSNITKKKIRPTVSGNALAFAQ
ncbi:hypothetical protein IPF86_02360 [Candidatus Nomurabacteria bacterium]|jgi:hypothetical protein|nr:MAG: hypothetical protein IPF86_02360 [Candidatus Nomurabacteria bacterium]